MAIQFIMFILSKQRLSRSQWRKLIDLCIKYVILEKWFYLNSVSVFVSVPATANCYYLLFICFLFFLFVSMLCMSTVDIDLFIPLFILEVINIIYKYYIWKQATLWVRKLFNCRIGDLYQLIVYVLAGLDLEDVISRNKGCVNA